MADLEFEEDRTYMWWTRQFLQIAAALLIFAVIGTFLVLVFRPGGDSDQPVGSPNANPVTLTQEAHETDAGGREVITTRKLGLEGATSMGVSIGMSSGSLNVESATDELLDATFEHREQQGPDISYEVSDGRGTLELRQSSPAGGAHDDKWDLRLNGEVPIDLTIQIASGAMNLDLTSLRIASLDIEAASGVITLDLGDEQPDLTSVSVEAASGNASVNLDGNFPNLKSVKVYVASGVAEVGLAGSYDAFELLDVDALSGAVNVSVTGQFGRDVDAEITMASGALNFGAQTDVGVEVMARTEDGEITVSEFLQDGDKLVNDAYGISDVTVRVTAEITGQGDIGLNQDVDEESPWWQFWD